MAKAHNQTQKESKHESHGEMKRPISPPRPNVNGVMQESVRLLDAHLIFEPILTCLGVMPNNISNSGVLFYWNVVLQFRFYFFFFFTISRRIILG